jgi:hypothetical protein
LFRCFLLCSCTRLLAKENKNNKKKKKKKTNDTANKYTNWICIYTARPICFCCSSLLLLFVCLWCVRSFAHICFWILSIFFFFFLCVCVFILLRRAIAGLSWGGGVDIRQDRAANNSTKKLKRESKKNFKIIM